MKEFYEENVLLKVGRGKQRTSKLRKYESIITTFTPDSIHTSKVNLKFQNAEVYVVHRRITKKSL